MAIATVTVTAKVGAAIQATALAIQNVSNVNLDFNREVLQLVVGGSVNREFDFNSVTTASVTISAAGGNATITFS